MDDKENAADAGHIDAAQEVTQPKSTPPAIPNQDSKAPPFTFTPPVASQAVNIEHVLDEISAILKRHVVVRDEERDLIALWVVFTYCYQCFRHSPRLLVSSPEMQCGKTTLFEILSQLVLKGFHVSNVTAATLFRTIDKYRPTILADEADTYIYGNEGMRNILNQGHTKAGSKVMRSSSDKSANYAVQYFDTFSAMAIGQIGWPPDTVADRCIPVLMKRKLPHEKIEPFNINCPATLCRCLEIQAQIQRWVLDNHNLLSVSDPAMPSIIKNRTADKVRPLFAIATLASPAWLARVESAAVKMLRYFPVDGRSLGVQALQDIYDHTVGRPRFLFSTVELLSHLNSLDDRPWSTCLNGKPLTAHKLGALLQPFGIRSKNIRPQTGGQLKGYDMQDFEDAVDRYLEVP